MDTHTDTPLPLKQNVNKISLPCVVYFDCSIHILKAQVEASALFHKGLQPAVCIAFFLGFAKKQT